MAKNIWNNGYISYLCKILKFWFNNWYLRKKQKWRETERNLAKVEIWRSAKSSRFSLNVCRRLCILFIDQIFKNSQCFSMIKKLSWVFVSEQVAQTFNSQAKTWLKLAKTFKQSTKNLVEISNLQRKPKAESNVWEAWPYIWPITRSSAMCFSNQTQFFFCLTFVFCIQTWKMPLQIWKRLIQCY